MKATLFREIVRSRARTRPYPASVFVDRVDLAFVEVGLHAEVALISTM